MPPLLYETHSHTTLCRHACGTTDEYAEAALQRGLKGLIVTCHNPMPDSFAASSRMYPEQFGEYLTMVDEARLTWQGRVDVRLGLEADYFPGFEGWLERQLGEAEFHYVLGSVHPQLTEFRERFWTGNPVEFQQAYFSQLVAAAETGLFDCLSHPDLVKNLTPHDWRPDQALEFIRPALDRIAATGVAMELNTSGLMKTIREMNPFPAMLREMSGRRIPVVVGADAHVPQRVGDRYVTALTLLAECGYDETSIFLDRRRQAIPITRALRSLKAAVGC